MTSELIRFNHLRCHSSWTALWTRTGYWKPTRRGTDETPHCLKVTKSLKIQCFNPALIIKYSNQNLTWHASHFLVRCCKYDFRITYLINFSLSKLFYVGPMGEKKAFPSTVLRREKKSARFCCCTPAALRSFDKMRGRAPKGLLCIKGCNFFSTRSFRVAS